MERISVTTVFLSQPMNGRDEKKIQADAEKYLQVIKDKFGFPKVKRVGWITEDCGEHGPLFYLGKSLEAMADADIVAFCPGWDKARGCRIEWEAAVAYGKSIVYLEK